METQQSNDKTTGHLFAGGGGDTQGAIAAGYNPIWAVEYDKYAAAVFRYRYPQTRLIQDDITSLSDDFIRNLTTPDVIIGGSPCPDFSSAGARAGLAGDRGQLFFEYIRFLRILQPKYFIFENVKGILTSNCGYDFQEVLRCFAEVGYVGSWQLKNASEYVPQNRERVFCVGMLRQYSDQQPITGQTTSISGNRA